jgi:cytochrome c oxidase subunit IV
MSASVDQHEHAHPGPAIYLRVGIILFILTAAEVAVYELAYHHAGSGLGALLHPVVIPILLLLSAVKFTLVAMFYMHLKQDSKLFSGLFIFPILIAAFIIAALMTLISYLYLLHPRPPA